MKVGGTNLKYTHTPEEMAALFRGTRELRHISEPILLREISQSHSRLGDGHYDPSRVLDDITNSRGPGFSCAACERIIRTSDNGRHGWHRRLLWFSTVPVKYQAVKNRPSPLCFFSCKQNFEQFFRLRPDADFEVTAMEWLRVQTIRAIKKEPPSCLLPRPGGRL